MQPLVIDPPELSELAERERLQAAASGLVSRLEGEAIMRVTRRQPTEQRWVDDLRRYHGLYDPTVDTVLKADDERSQVFINLTRAKTTAWAARLGDMLFPNDEKNWGISPTPVPELTDAAKKVAAQAEEAETMAKAKVEEHNQAADVGNNEGAATAREQADKAAAIGKDARSLESQMNAQTSEAKKIAARMEAEIADQLVECRYPSRARDCIDDATKLGPGVLKGPLTSSRPRRKWQKDEATGEYRLSNDKDPRPDYRRVDPWHFFPDPDAVTMDDCESTLERHILSKKSLIAMAKRLEFDMGTVREIVKDGATGQGFGESTWFTQLRLMESDKGGTAYTPQSRFAVWEYHGPLECSEVECLLRASGMEDRATEFMAEADPLEQHMVIVYFSGGKLLKIEENFPLDSGESLYSVFAFEKAEASIMGAVGVPYLMRHEQAMLNAAVRMMLDNAALSVGPQIVIDQSQIEPANGGWKLIARKIWKAKGSDIARTQPPFSAFNIPINQAQLAGMIELAIRFVDEVVSMPVIAQGEQGAHVTQTAGGMSMLFNSANVVFRRVVKNWDDDITTPTLRRAFDWNMQFSKKEEIKGDMQVEARGTSVLLVREIQSQQLTAIATTWSTHPVIGPAIKVYDILRMTLQTMSISPSDVLVEPDEFERRIKAMSEQSAPTPDEIRAQTSLEVAKIDAESRKLQGDTTMQIAQLNRDTEIMKLIQKGDTDLAAINASLDKMKITTDSKERIFAAEAAVERQADQERAALGVADKGSGGYIS